MMVSEQHNFFSFLNKGVELEQEKLFELGHQKHILSEPFVVYI